MQAKETKLQDIIEGTKQYVIPLFQRTYSWTQNEWEILWQDLIELCEMEIPRTHFIGSIVNMPTVSVPEGVAKYLLIDGQQRLTTIFILLTLLRNKAKEANNNIFADEINDTLLVNQYKKDIDHYKLLPTQVDRAVYRKLIDGEPIHTDNAIAKAYSYFEKKLKQVRIEPEQIMKVITSYFSIVSITLDSDDNPYLVFESLNAKGKPLTQADLIRNLFFMRIHVNNQDEIYHSYWYPMQSGLGDNLTEFIRHFLMRDGNIINKNDVYYSLKNRITNANLIDYLKELKKFSEYYERLLDPENNEPVETIKKCLIRLNRIEVTTAYPLLLNIYDVYQKHEITKEDFVSILNILENFLIRRFVCNVPTNQLNKIFPPLFSQILDKFSDDFVIGFKNVLQTKGYPKDNEFKQRLKDTKIYGAGDRLKRTKLILETIEEFYDHKETVSWDNLTIEHVMPQTLSEWWQNHLGEDWDETHELYLHTIGNLTLTAYNSELSNDDFLTKRHTFQGSHLELNKYFSELTAWTRQEIEDRAETLANKALEIWNSFGDSDSGQTGIQEVKGTTPTALFILGQQFSVESWRDVLQQTLNTIADLEPEKFEMIIQKYPRFVQPDKKRFRVVRELANGFFIEVNLNAQTIQNFCYQAIETIGLTSEDWYVTVN